jgi:O-antigen ligase
MIIVTIGALAATFFIGAAIGQGEFIQIYLLFFGVAALVAVFGMGSRYWMLIPIAFSFNLPAIPFRGRAFELPEIAIAVCSVIFVCRYAISSRGITIFRWSHAAVIMYAVWAGIIFLIHPVGLMATGSTTGGARFYFKIALALAAFLIVANQRISERDAKWIIRLLLVGSVVSMVVNIVQYKIAPPAFADPNALTDEGYYTWHQSLSGPAMWFMLWLSARFRIKEILGFGKPWTLFLALCCIAIAAVSGKRAGLASVLLTPLIVAILRKENFYVISGAVFAAILLFFLTAGQGTWFRLPLQVQRSLSYLPGKWDWEVQSQVQGGIDPFRQELRQLAWGNIKAHPIVGQGYAVNARELYGMGRMATNLSEFGIMVMALGSSWHNTWLGYWADFGLPAIIFWAIFWLQAIVVGYRLYRNTTHGTSYRTLGLMILLYFICDILRSWTSGHSADDPFTRWWMYAVMLSMAASLKQIQGRGADTRTSSTTAYSATERSEIMIADR